MRSLVRSSLLLLLLACGSGAMKPSGTHVPFAITGATDLGSVTAGTELTFDVPAHTAGFTLVVDGTVTPDDFLGVQELTAPDGTSLVRDFDDVRAPSRKLSGAAGTGVGTLRFPLVDDFARESVPAGKWKVRLGGSTRVTGGAKGEVTAFLGQVHGSLLLQPESAAGAFDVQLYVPDGLNVGGHTVSAATAADDSEMKLRVDSLFAQVQRLYGIERGTVTFHAIDARFKNVTGEDAVNEAHQQATLGGRVQIVLTNVLDPEGVGEISGLCSCLPGAPGTSGNVCSSVLVSFRSSSPAWQDATTAVHELGHFVGLEHSTQLDGEADGLADTPACTDTSKGGLTHCPDHNNLMFPSVNLSDDELSVTVSPTQRALFRASALYRSGL